MSNEARASDLKVGDLVSSAVADAQTLVRGQVELAVTELKANAKSAASGSALLIGAGTFGFLSFIFALVAAALGLAHAGLPDWAGFLIVGGILLLLAGILALVGRSRAKNVSAPIATQRQVEATRALLTSVKK